jgi:hypothetical protein
MMLDDAAGRFGSSARDGATRVWGGLKSKSLALSLQLLHPTLHESTLCFSSPTASYLMSDLTYGLLRAGVEGL